uniref:Uncharacterized protein n=1 Tax=Chromera velia CCMP2878 TaxID=1169474 RepID=A0A0G4I3K1_9ALVE|eukprot:Cvel_1760.t1-p1 / transcript=Cvel_1760.t1 / gene=Cvel_1760 / organism=Chromera_velia_CCMP2878 / gene_product=hypothetical protein / transcript_product=hypothetical protein / location=Cvel_scaffold64:84525-87274(-) / protein_length=275 / sequence_SO=supercontig / SO=protein_coding / is_pseudo=false
MEIDTQEGSGAQRVFSHEDIQRVVQSVCTVDPPAVPLDFCQDQAVAVIRALHAEGTSLVQTFQATQKRVGEEAEAREKELKEKSDQVRRFVGHVKRLSEGLQQANEEAHARDIELAREKGEVPRRLEARTLQYLEGCKYGIDAYFPELLKGSPGEWTDAASHDFVKFLEEQNTSENKFPSVKVEFGKGAKKSLFNVCVSRGAGGKFRVRRQGLSSYYEACGISAGYKCAVSPPHTVSSGTDDNASGEEANDTHSVPGDATGGKKRARIEEGPGGS